VWRFAELYARTGRLAAVWEITDPWSRASSKGREAGVNRPTDDDVRKLLRVGAADDRAGWIGALRETLNRGLASGSLTCRQLLNEVLQRLDATPPSPTNPTRGGIAWPA
jgi:hypothetical protein